MQRLWIDDKLFRALFCIMVVALIILAIIPRKFMIIGSANDNDGNFVLDANYSEDYSETGIDEA